MGCYLYYAKKSAHTYKYNIQAAYCILRHINSENIKPRNCTEMRQPDNNALDYKVIDKDDGFIDIFLRINYDQFCKKIS